MPWAITWYVVLVLLVPEVAGVVVLELVVEDASLLLGALSLAPAAASLAVRLTLSTDGSLKKSSSTGSLLEDRPVLCRRAISFLYILGLVWGG